VEAFQLAKRAFQKTLAKIPDDCQRAIVTAIRLLGMNSRPEGKRTKKFIGQIILAQFTAEYRLRFGPYRILYDARRNGLTALWVRRTLCVAVTQGDCMPTNLAIDDALLERARRIGKLRTKKETVTQALTEFIQRRRQRDILKVIGTISFRKDWDYKRDRRDRESGR
jgi:Arc/MetJ family transcription regulator/mRNA-degrading endonuclease RelE of RelBE toxin-antitoxin system